MRNLIVLLHEYYRVLPILIKGQVFGGNNYTKDCESKAHEISTILARINLSIWLCWEASLEPELHLLGPVTAATTVVALELEERQGTYVLSTF